MSLPSSVQYVHRFHSLLLLLFLCSFLFRGDLTFLLLLQWGTGTSNIFSNDMDMENSNDPEGFSWPESRSAVVLAVGAIVIPAIDGFVNSNRVEQWNDKVCTWDAAGEGFLG